VTGRPRAGAADPARRAAYDVLRAVETSDAYANLVLPRLLTERGIRGRDAAFATELAYGTLRLRGRYDAVLTRTSTRPLREVDAPLLDVLRLGVHQLLGMRVPAHAAVSETVALARDVAGTGRASFANAVLRAVARRDLDDWLAELRTGPDALAAELSHPAWVVRAMRESLVVNGRAVDELPDLLAADNAAPEVTLVARPGLVTADRLAEDAAAAGLRVAGRGRLAPTALRLTGGEPSALAAVRDGRAGVQDEGSQLVALAAAAAGLRAPGPHRWLDLCAGPGGKTALLAAVLRERGGGDARLVAQEVAPHRVQLVRQAVRALASAVEVEVRQGDGRDVGEAEPGRYDLVLVDAPCTGLGALRRRPEARWRRRPEDLTQLTALQRDLVASAVAATAPGGVIAYVTCSPHLAETHAVAADALGGPGLDVLDAREAVRAAAVSDVPDLGPGPFVQLWPHRHGTDAMFLALARRRP
jgi:16S rRNA (cytosine967-C5)-methyltransferase